jgi:ACS family tartrate transporter-like MFS transporter
MDRVNISFAAESMNRDLHFTPTIYGLGAGLFFLTYALCEIPSNRLLLHFGARRWLARIMLTWGLLAVGMAFVRSPGSFYGMRMLLGVAEAGYFPGVIFYLAQWFPKAERAKAISLFYIAFPLSSVVMGGLAGVLLRQSGRLGLAGWQWLFVVEGLPAVLLSAAIWFTLPDAPASAAWLTVEERAAVAEELAHTEVAAHGVGYLRAALRSRYVWGFGLFFFFTLGSNYAISFSLPLVLRLATGWTIGRVGWLIAGIGVLSAVAMVLNARDSDKRGERKWHIVVPTVVMGFGMLVASFHTSGWIGVGALTVAAISFFAIQGPMLGVVSRVVPGNAAAVAIATINMCAICGGFVGPYWMGWMREATGSYAVGIGGLCVPCLLAGGWWFGCCRGGRRSRMCRWVRALHS